MTSYKKKPNFSETDAGIAAKQSLTAMADDASYYTEASYSANTRLHPDNHISFVDKHMEYLQNHPAIDPWQYIANLRLMTRIKK